MVGHRILLVDDDPDIRAIIGAVLRPQFEVVEASDGADALRRLEAYEPDFAIVDAAMPVMDGFNLCQAIRKHDRFRGLPVIFLSAHNTQTEIKRGYASGANLYLAKPIDPKRIIKNIEFTITHEKVEARPKRYSLNQLEAMDDEFQRRAAEEPTPESRQQKSWNSAPRERLQAKNWQISDETPRPQKPEPREERPEPQPASARVSSRSYAPPPEELEIKEENIEVSDIEDRDYVMDTPRQSARPQNGPSRGERPAAAQPIPTQTQKQNSGLLPRVMIVENEDDARELMEITLRREYEVTTARDGLEAVQNIVAYQPDLLLIDIMMPRMNGYQLLQSLRRNPAFQKLPVVVVSAKTTPRDREYVFRLGATDFIPKPFDAQDLLQCLEKVVSQPSFRVQAKRIPIVEIVEKEYLQAKNKTELGSEGRDQSQKMTGLKEALKREGKRKF
jgi:two-component system alkaline phosphatase synthesis response regulator PhoP